MATHDRMTETQLVEDAERLNQQPVGTPQRAEKKAPDEPTRLPDSGETYKILADNSFDEILILDSEGKILFATPATVKMFGFKKTVNLVDAYLLDYVTPEYRDRAAQDQKKVMAGSGGFLSEYKGVKRDGTEFWVEGFGIMVSFRGERASLIILRDITGRVEARNHLEGGEQKYFDILENIHEACFETDLEGNYTFVNDAVGRILGHSREELLCMNSRDNTSPEMVEKAVPVFREVYRTGMPADIEEYTIVGKDGRPRIRKLHVSLRRDFRGDPIGFRGISLDVKQQVETERALEESEERYRTILESIEEGYFEVDLAGNFTFVNDALCDIFRYKRDEIIGTNHREHTNPETAKRAFSIFNEVYRTGKPSNIKDYEVTKKDGSIGIREMHISLLKDRKGKPIGFRGLSRDVTERVRAERSLKESEERYRNLFEKTASPIMITDPEGRFIDWNEAALAFLECTREELLEKNVHDFLPQRRQEDTADREKTYWKQDRTIEAEYLIRGRVKILELSMTPAVLNGKDVVFGVGKDITERKQAEERLAYMATHDQLTSLPNRALFADRLEHELEKSRHNNGMIAVILFDLDRFKGINDTLGHGIGDLLLKELGCRLKGCLRHSDTVARMGGDEFFMLLCDITNEKDADIIADKILEAIRRPFVVKSDKIHVTASLGIAFYPKDGDDVETLIKKADIAMYRAKANGRNHYGHYSS